MIIGMVMIIVSYFLAKTAPLLVKKAWIGVVIKLLIYFVYQSNDKLNFFAYLIRLLKTLYYLLSDFFVLYYLIYGLTAILGTFLNPFLFAFHLFDILVRYPELKNVIMSVWM